MAGFLTQITEWMIRAVLLISLSAHVVLTLLASIRRHQRSGVCTVVLWSAYQVTDWAAPFVLSNMSLGSTSTEQQLVAMWLPFLLMHLGGPDNITAYSFDDNNVSMRQVISTLLRFQAILFAIYRQYKMVTIKGAMFWASSVMVAVGVAKYVERVRALRNGDFGNIRSSGSKQSKALRIPPHGRRGKLDDEQALLVAHEMFHITKGAFADYSVPDRQLKGDPNKKELFPVISWKSNIGWENMCKVVEMELSLMYDILYTKAAKIHTWEGYLIRIVSPIATATMTALFCFYSKDGQRTADVTITYVLLVVTFLLELTWLLRDTASTWTYTFFSARQECWLHHEVFCRGRWHKLRRVIMRLEPRQLLFSEPRHSYRLWSGTIGSYNLFDECTHNTTDLPRTLANMLGLEDTWIEYEYSRRCKLGISGSVRDFLFSQIGETLKKVYFRGEKAACKACKPLAESDNYGKLERIHLLDDALGFVPDFQELILILHVATEVVLIDIQHQLSKDEEEYKNAIETVSNYLTFLAAVRPDMLPGLNLRTLFNETRTVLSGIWKQEQGSSSSKDELARILRRKDKETANSKSVLYRESIILSNAIKFAEVLLELLKSRNIKKAISSVVEGGVDPRSKERIMFLIKNVIPDFGKHNCLLDYTLSRMLQLILKSWIRILIYVSSRCGRDSHARQLGRGCELTTIVWILGEHAGIFWHE